MVSTQRVKSDDFLSPSFDLSHPISARCRLLDRQTDKGAAFITVAVC